MKNSICKDVTKAKMAQDRRDFMESCKTGDLHSVSYLLEVKEVEPNLKDEWNSTALYYACLCGHKNVVIYLLENGAKCEAKTFDGERCLYGALTDEIRDILKSYKAVVTGHARRNFYLDFMKRLLEASCYSDITFVIHNETFAAHRCILQSRNEYFAEMLETRWKNKSTVHIKSSLVRPQAFKRVLEYVYTGTLQVHINIVDDCLRFAKQCGMTSLIEKINQRLKEIEDYVPSKPGTHIHIVSVEPSLDDTPVQDDLNQLAQMAFPVEKRDPLAQGVFPFCGGLLQVPPYTDVCFEVEQDKFFCHKMFFTERSDYFKGLFADHFNEVSLDQNSIPIISLHEVTSDVFMQVIYYLYTDSVNLTEDLCYEILVVADLYLLPGLKRLCANKIASQLTEESVFQVLRVSRMFSLVKLEDQCVEFISRIVERITDNEEFIELVKEDAASVENREEVDSITIIDDLRYHIANNLKMYSELQEAQEKLSYLDHLLQELGIEG
ncbi:ankyrin repeat and BTB/POZ domain-containing protein 1 isoform X2 [Strongylocentrotus purpuratus]|uniref:BTB domain-containing protein n=1 Tax=Strongylocentrotus purpuratus TaxID=7668 RepID=A0A7M7RE13_STRPU|nr:ankyrin repeat and BTB/POZ domain-containing protein 1 isoform X2 [Strongylocentrotus purpuratus]|eukprot:XP_788155.3 PREDICTED: ankyrin repeat and BTB/POZ domain-containing protein 1 isoform X2 [Strongylocentrotus purpuratus]